MSVGALTLLILIGLIVGLLIGALGIGGVLLVPSLVHIGSIPIHTAIPACMLSYMASGLIGASVYARRGSINWPMAGRISLGALPGAYIGAVCLSYFPAVYIEIAIASLMIFTGYDALKPRPERTGTAPRRARHLVPLGFVTGVGSAITGTGGPLILVPILIWMKLPILTAVGLSQIVQIPISALSTIANLNHGQVDFRLAAAIAVVMITGVSLGARLAHRLPAALLKRIVGVVLMAVGLSWYVRLGLNLALPG